MKYQIRILLITALFVFLQGCNSYQIRLVENSDPFHPSFTLSNNTNPVRVASISVYALSEEEKVWRIGRTYPSEILTQYEITYGIIPKGMYATLDAKPLKKDTVYMITCRYGDYGTISYFKIVQKDDIFKAIEVKGI